MDKGLPQGMAGSSATPKEAVRPQNSDLCSYLFEKTEKKKKSLVKRKDGQAMADEWFKLLKAIKAKKMKTPGKNQWSNVRELALRYLNDGKELREKLKKLWKDETNEAGVVVNVNNRKKIWVEPNVGGKSLAGAILGPDDKPADLDPMVVFYASVEMGRKLSRKGDS